MALGLRQRQPVRLYLSLNTDPACMLKLAFLHGEDAISKDFEGRLRGGQGGGGMVPGVDTANAWCMHMAGALMGLSKRGS